MKINLPEQIDKKQWLTRLDVTGEMPEGLEVQLEQAERKLLETAVPQGVFREVGLEDFFFSDEGAAFGEWLELPGMHIKRHLDGCKHAAIMAVTLGAGIDRLIRTAQIRDMAEAVILDSGASILAEQIADELERQIKIAFATSYLSPRFSPGYGDFPIEMQGELIRAVDGPRMIGLTVNESNILVPRKSITAIIGIAEHPVKGYLATCEECLLKESCRLRKEGKQCWT